MKQSLFFDTEILKSDHLVADSQRNAYYNIWLEKYFGKYIVKKDSGIRTRSLNSRQWAFDTFEEADRFYDQKLQEKTRKNRKRSYRRMTSDDKRVPV